MLELRKYIDKRKKVKGGKKRDINKTLISIHKDIGLRKAIKNYEYGIDFLVNGERHNFPGYSIPY